MSSNLRMSRINKQLQREIALIIENKIQKESVKGTIITGVECTKDLERAKVFFTALEARKCPGILKDLNEIKGAIRGMLGQSIKLRRVPALDFYIDKSSAYGAKIDSILEKLGFGLSVRSEELGVRNDDSENDNGENF
ncbi:MAG: 30S ribosome-binding factor RbfA [Synergistaceae bacterium]|nr:30S ribosome-binding factor RbfA [Synergistaceae bacterium]